MAVSVAGSSPSDTEATGLKAPVPLLAHGQSQVRRFARRVWKFRAALCVAAVLARGVVTASAGTHQGLQSNPAPKASSGPTVPEEALESQSDESACIQLRQEPQGVDVHSDLGGQDSSAYLEPSPEDTPSNYSMASFKHFAKKVLLANELTPQEIQDFKTRFVRKMKRFIANGGDIKTAKRAAWKRLVKMALNSEKPIVTEKIAEKINRAKLGWKAKKLAGMANVSMDSMKKFLGLHPNFGKKLGYIKLKKGGPWESKVHDYNKSKSSSVEETPEDFDVRTKWQRCVEVFNHKRDQGQCANCWAQAAASVIESQKCIFTEGLFTGWISAAYISACYHTPDTADGCQEGDPEYALSMAFNNGVPTGGGHDDIWTCDPYWGEGSGPDRADVDTDMQAPACPTECSGKYPKSLEDDKTYMNPNILGLNVHTDHLTAQRRLMEGGPIMMAMEIYSDLFAYAGGYYTPSLDATVDMGHVVTLLGWTHRPEDKQLYWTAKNSWKVDGDWWGEESIFKVDSDCCLIGYITLEFDYVPTGAQRS